jgi:hypothetical protein
MEVRDLVEAEAERVVCPLKAIHIHTPNLTGTQVDLLLGKDRLPMAVLPVVLESDRNQAGSVRRLLAVLGRIQPTVHPLVLLVVLPLVELRVPGSELEKKQRRKKRSGRPRRQRRNGRRIWRRESRRRGREKLAKERREKPVRKKLVRMQIEGSRMNQEGAHMHIPLWAKRRTPGQGDSQIHPPRDLLLRLQRLT